MRKLLFGLLLISATVAARAEQKNVNVLTGLTDAQLSQAMNAMRASLGVNCDFCHVAVAGKEQLDYPNDSKEEKRIARDMIGMVQKLNEQDFHGMSVISCNTCHRGSTLPQSLVSLPQVQPPIPTPKRERPVLPALDEIVKKYAAAVGYTAKWSDRTLTGTRESTDGKSVPIDEEVAGRSVHTASEGATGKVEWGVTADSGWTRNRRGLQDAKADRVEQFRELFAAYVPTPPSAIPADARVVTKEKIGDRETVVVATKPVNGRRQRFWFDTTTGLLVRRLIITDSQVGPIPTQSDFDDWRDAGGAKYPFTVRASFTDPWNSSTHKYADVKLGAKVDEAVFAKPGS